MAIERISYRVGNKHFVSALVYDERVTGKRPLLLVAPNWLGMTDEVIERTRTLAGSRFVGFVADMYGEGKSSAGPPEAAQLADALRGDVTERRARITGALSTLTTESEKRGIGDVARKAAVGFCFGGGNVLELARTGADLKAAICLHGDLATQALAKVGDVKAALFVAHGAADPAAPKAQRDAFEAEMETAKAKWQMHIFGHVAHSFCEPEANIPGIAEYNEPAAQQTYRMIEQFISDAFDGRL
ncbi:MAG: dienelactone hydrolase family protein [Xanthobacteraceae bacterium]